MLRLLSSRWRTRLWLLAAPLLWMSFASSAAAQAASCQVTYTKSWEGGTGFGAAIHIVNTGPAITSGWSLVFAFANGQTIANGWPVNFTQSGSTVTVSSNAAWNQS